MVGRALALTVAGAVALGAPLASQQTPPTFRSKADLVRLHVVVRDAQGRPVHGLTKDDFAVLDTKQPRVIEIFEEVSRPAAALPLPIVPARFPLDVADNRTARASRLVVIVLDDMVIRPYIETSKQLARDAVSKLGTDALLALLLTSGTDGVEATADHSAILRAIERVGTTRSKAPRIPQRFGSQTSHATLAEMQTAGGTAKSCHLEMLTRAADMVVGPEATRKVFLYISPFCGMDKFLPATADDPHTIASERLMEALRRADVAMYALDPRGQMGFSLDQFPASDITGAASLPWEAMAGRRVTTRSSSPVLNSQAGLRELTQATGGFAVTNSPAFERGLDQIAEDLGHFYVLGFYANDPRPNRYHPVEVRMKRPGLTGRFRPGYFSGTPAVREDKDPMVRLAAGAIPTPDLPMRLFAASEPSARGTRVSLVAEVGWTGLEKPDASGAWHESLDGMVMVAKVLSGRIERRWAVKRSVVVPMPAEARPAQGAYQVLTQVEMPPGSFQFRLSAKSLTGRTGSVYLAVDVPKITALGMSDILVGSADREPPVLAPSPANVTPLPFPITLDRVFRHSERIRLFARLSPSRAVTALTAAIQFFDYAGNVAQSIEAPLSGDGRVVDTIVSLSALTPGAYRAVMTVRSSKATESREVSLVVRP